MEKERIAHWLKVGARPSDRVAKFLANAELMKPRGAPRADQERTCRAPRRRSALKTESCRSSRCCCRSAGRTG